METSSCAKFPTYCGLTTTTCIFHHDRIRNFDLFHQIYKIKFFLSVNIVESNTLNRNWNTTSTRVNNEVDNWNKKRQVLLCSISLINQIEMKSLKRVEWLFIRWITSNKTFSRLAVIASLEPSDVYVFNFKASWHRPILLTNISRSTIFNYSTLLNSIFVTDPLQWYI